MALILWGNHIHDTFSILLLTPQHFLAALFFLTGHIFACSKVRRFNLLFFSVALIAVLIASRYWRMETADTFYDNHIILPYIITAIIGTWMVYSMPWHFVGLQMTRFMHYTGTHTLVILTWHFLCFKLVSLIIIHIYDLPYKRLAEFPIIKEYATQGWWVIYLLVGVSVPLLMTKMTEDVKSRLQHRYMH